MPFQTGVLIGSGGMGEVYRAWDPELQRPVALKYLRSADPALVERLKREARAQARVDHPAVCRVYEVGEDDGRPFIAMQYVDGRHLDDAARDLSLEQKVLLLREVAEAVQAAHAVGLVHRDLKPTNILVADSEDGRPRPYVLDFGIAREWEAPGLTVTGQVLGTPGYLSPEQAGGEVAALDRRTDVFSLGVILYELLTDRRPFRGDSQVQVLLALLCEDPTPLRQLDASIPRDLETVVMRCLEKDPDRRYPSARALADDLGRFLAGEPVTARPVGAAERLVRRARRHPFAATAVAVAVLASAALVTVAVGGWVKYTVDLQRERNAAVDARAVAESREAEAREIADFLAGVFEVADPNESGGDEVTAREILDRGAARIDRGLAERPESRGRLLGVLGGVYTRLGLYEDALPLLERSLELARTAPRNDVVPELSARVRLGDLLLKMARIDRAEEVLRPVPATLEAAPDLDPLEAAKAFGCLSRLQHERGNMVASAELLDRAVARAERDAGPDAALVGDLLSDRAALWRLQSQWRRAIADGRRALELRERHYGSDDPRVATTLNTLMLAFQGAGRLDEAVSVGERALTLRERTLGPDHPRTATALNNLGLVCKKLGRFDRAEELYRRALEIRRRTLGDDHPRVATVYYNLGSMYMQRGELDRAEEMQRRGLEVTEAAYGPDHQKVATMLTGLAAIASLRGQYDLEEQITLRILRIRQATYGPDSPSLAPALRNLGDNLRLQGRATEALELYTRGRRIALAAYGEDHPLVAELDERLAELGPSEPEPPSTARR